MRVEGDEEPAGALDEEQIGLLAAAGDERDQARHVDGHSLEPGGDGGRERRAQAIGADVVERRGIGGGGAERERVGRLALDPGLDRLHHRDAPAPLAERGRERARDERLADARVGAGDEQGAHAPVASSIASRATSTSRSSSAGAIASAGMSTITLPSGRRITPRARAARTTRWPMRAAGG